MVDNEVRQELRSRAARARRSAAIATDAQSKFDLMQLAEMWDSLAEAKFDVYLLKDPQPNDDA